MPALEPVAVDDSTVVTFRAYCPQSHAALSDSAHLGRLVHRA
jgi:hypothetical protein